MIKCRDYKAFHNNCLKCDIKSNLKCNKIFDYDTPKKYIMSNEIEKIINKLLNKATEENLTIWLVEEETGEAIKLYDLLNSVKYSEDAIFKRIK